MEALSGLIDVRFILITTVPERFFRDSLTASYSVHPLQVDVGPVQLSPLEIDLPATVDALRKFYPVVPKRIRQLADLLSGCHLVISDIAPAALAAARDADVPSVLVENFTWDWIYQEYLESWPELAPVISHIRELYSLAVYRVQAEPVCGTGRGDLLAAPVARRKRNDRDGIRRMLGVENGQNVVLISMGGGGTGPLPLNVPAGYPDTVFLVPGPIKVVPPQSNIRVIAEDSGFFHPDLVAAADAVIGKVGYSTLAEVFHAGVPFGYIRRPGFRESEPLARFIRRHMAGIEIAADDFAGGSWTTVLPRLFALKDGKNSGMNGADQCARFLVSLLSRIPES